MGVGDNGVPHQIWRGCNSASCPFRISYFSWKTPRISPYCWRRIAKPWAEEDCSMFYHFIFLHFIILFFYLFQRTQNIFCELMHSLMSLSTLFPFWFPRPHSPLPYRSLSLSHFASTMKSGPSFLGLTLLTPPRSGAGQSKLKKLWSIKKDPQLMRPCSTISHRLMCELRCETNRMIDPNKVR